MNHSSLGKKSSSLTNMNFLFLHRNKIAVYQLFFKKNGPQMPLNMKDLH